MKKINLLKVSNDNKWLRSFEKNYILYDVDRNVLFVFKSIYHIKIVMGWSNNQYSYLMRLLKHEPTCKYKDFFIETVKRIGGERPRAPLSDVQKNNLFKPKQ